MHTIRIYVCARNNYGLHHDVHLVAVIDARNKEQLKKANQSMPDGQGYIWLR